MKEINTVNPRRQGLSATLLLAVALSFFGNAAPVLAHGGEDHGDEKPKTATTTSGTVTRSTRLGDFEIMLKHSPLEPDTATAGRLFITKFATNEPVGDVNPAMEIESANGVVTEIPIEKTGAVGSYTVKIPALPEGAYTIRTKTIAEGGKTSTATFSGVEIAHQETAAAETASGSWTQTALMAMLFLVAVGLFGGLAYFAQRVFTNKPLGKETVSA
jgi:hypothetical protein